jgi:hypothetical protein
VFPSHGVGILELLKEERGESYEKLWKIRRRFKNCMVRRF